jgi:acetoin utilization protein AcuC
LKARFIASPRFASRGYGRNHPLAIPRVSLAHGLARACGLIGDGEYLEARCASDAELAAFHDPDYVAALRRAQRTGGVAQADRARYALGTLENPWFQDVFTRPATAAGGSLQAADEVLAGRRAFNPAGGMHHARRGRAQGFCYFNDNVLGILRLRAAGLRVLYVDLDAHYPDGVAEALRGDAQVLVVSLHMDTSYAYPKAGGGLDDAQVVNLPLPRGVNDAEYLLAFEALWPRALERFAPDAVMLQAGTDIIAPDPLGKFAVTTQGFLAAVARVVEDAPRLAVTGGGGYHPLLVARAWAGVWSLLSGRVLPEPMPAAGGALLAQVDWRPEDERLGPWLLESFADPAPAAIIRPEVRELAARAARHRRLA